MNWKVYKMNHNSYFQIFFLFLTEIRPAIDPT
jgi:hypothetical protein